MSIPVTHFARFGAWRAGLRLLHTAFGEGQYWIGDGGLNCRNRAALRGGCELRERAHEDLGRAVVRAQAEDDPGRSQLGRRASQTEIADPRPWEAKTGRKKQIEVQKRPIPDPIQGICLPVTV